jgi:hypothetical protein
LAFGDRGAEVNVPTLFEVLTGCGGWTATPGDYKSMRSLRFAPDGTGQVLYGYGQTICAVIACRFAVIEPDWLEWVYLESPPYQWFKGFRPEDGNGRKALRAVLTAGEFTFSEAWVSHSSLFRWRLDLGGSPYPEGLSFPYSVPTTFYGHGRAIPRVEAEAESGAADVTIKVNPRPGDDGR